MNLLSNSFHASEVQSHNSTGPSAQGPIQLQSKVSAQGVFSSGSLTGKDLISSFAQVHLQNSFPYVYMTEDPYFLLAVI